MADPVPEETILAFARSISDESKRYGFNQVDNVRLINALMDSATIAPAKTARAVQRRLDSICPVNAENFPLTSAHLRIRRADPASDLQLLREWMEDEYGRHFLLTAATAQRADLARLLEHPGNIIGIIERIDSRPIGAVAYLDVDTDQRRAELRKLIGDPTSRGQGLAEEATMLWLEYGRLSVGLEKIYVSTLQTHLRNIALNESIGFQVEGVLHDEVRIGRRRFDVLRMGLCLGRDANK